MSYRRVNKDFLHYLSCGLFSTKPDRTTFSLTKLITWLYPSLFQMNLTLPFGKSQASHAADQPVFSGQFCQQSHITLTLPKRRVKLVILQTNLSSPKGRKQFCQQSHITMNLPKGKGQASQASSTYLSRLSWPFPKERVKHVVTKLFTLSSANLASALTTPRHFFSLNFLKNCFLSRNF